MKALTLEAPKQWKRIDVPGPEKPGPDQALVRVDRVGICGTDISGYLGKMPFFSYPRIPGHELGVEVVDVGSDVAVATPIVANRIRRSASTVMADCGPGSWCRPASCTCRAS
jgi:alcohol dehydrogenase